jgi:hypothetical protein
VSAVAIDMRAICAECGHVRSWHDRDAARTMQSGELASDRQCYREIGGAGCRCSGFRDSGEIAMVAGRPQTGLGFPTAVLVAVVLVFVGLGLLYAYRAQTPALTTIPMSQAIQEINSGQVAKVTVAGGRATLELRDGQKNQTTLPTPDDVFQKALADYNNANPSRAITIDYIQDGSQFTVLGSIFLSLLPVLLLGAFFLYLSSRLRHR